MVDLEDQAAVGGTTQPGIIRLAGQGQLGKVMLAEGKQLTIFMMEAVVVALAGLEETTVAQAGLA